MRMRKHYLAIDDNKTMNASYHIYKEDNIIFDIIDGQVTLDNLKNYDDYQFADPDYNDEYDTLVDLRGAEIILSFTDVNRFVDYFNNLPSSNGKKIACVFSPVYCQLFSTMLAANKSKIDIDIKFCKSLKTALNWFGKTELSSSFNEILDEARTEHQLVS